MIYYLTDAQIDELFSLAERPKIINVIFNDPATIVFWSDGTKTVVKVQPGDIFDPEKGIMAAISKKFDFYKDINKWADEYYLELTAKVIDKMNRTSYAGYSYDHYNEVKILDEDGNPSKVDIRKKNKKGE